ncbi:MAG: STAS/SEC14 domain-containing protein [Leptolyngbyaceae cyanobacterium bins.302]|nr:STAS/SEC14 domain-containing protein [Leptolyngbyaceae cyanobacterium bins.302]
MSTPDLEDFASQVLVLRAKRRSLSLSQSESELLSKINQGLPSELWERVEQLRAKQDDETLTSEERSEMIGLTEKIETANVERVKLLAELADLRGVPLSKLMQDLEVNSPVSV